MCGSESCPCLARCRCQRQLPSPNGHNYVQDFEPTSAAAKSYAHANLLVPQFKHQKTCQAKTVLCSLLRWPVPLLTCNTPSYLISWQSATASAYATDFAALLSDTGPSSSRHPVSALGSLAKRHASRTTCKWGTPFAKDNP